MADLANIAAATSAGYKELVAQNGAGRWQVTLEKTLSDVNGHDIVTQRAHGESIVSQAAAEAVALAALNTQRDERSRKGKGGLDAG
jgi:hypothetical protein